MFQRYVYKKSLFLFSIKDLFISEPGNPGLFTGTNFVVCLYGKFQSSWPGWNSRNKTKMVDHKLVSIATVVALWTLVTLLITLIRILLKWKYIQSILAAMLRKRSLCLKRFVPVTRAGVFIWENFHPGYRDLGNRASPASRMNTSKFYGRKSGEARSRKLSLPGWPGSYEESLLIVISKVYGLFVAGPLNKGTKGSTPSRLFCSFNGFIPLVTTGFLTLINSVELQTFFWRCGVLVQTKLKIKEK